ncbi:type II secretion system protein M [Pseudomonas fakonensis]|uniref:Type II secretion system protein M n=1 Tax=Pseudomonas fakonensis TaxID=2842355 RepID=A0ABX8N4C8_9PSED|nr:type II secretion system protein GspM [Pseudomonas fakonensis]QXH51202.1 type II secretion system protein M [Pseudomonas fakonensis]
MMAKLVSSLSAQWQGLGAPRRVCLQLSGWLLLAVLTWLWLWQPGQQRMRLAEQALSRELALGRQLLQVTGVPSLGAGQVLTPARLSEGATAAGLQIIDLHTREGRIEASLQGAPDALLQWLHGLEQGGARFTSLQLQARDRQLHVRLGLSLDPG